RASLAARSQSAPYHETGPSQKGFTPLFARIWAREERFRRRLELGQIHEPVLAPGRLHLRELELPSALGQRPLFPAGDRRSEYHFGPRLLHPPPLPLFPWLLPLPRERTRQRLDRRAVLLRHVIDLALHSLRDPLIHPVGSPP